MCADWLQNAVDREGSIPPRPAHVRVAKFTTVGLAWAAEEFDEQKLAADGLTLPRGSREIFRRVYR